MNYNLLARYLIDHKIENRLFQHLDSLTKSEWEYYREIINAKWLNPGNSETGISNQSILSKIDNNNRKLTSNKPLDSEKDRIEKKLKSSTKLKNGTYTLEDLKYFFDFSDPVIILIIISKNDVRKRIRVSNTEETQNKLAYIYDKRIEQYHPNSSGVLRTSPFTESDIRQILIHGSIVFANLNLSDANTFKYYADNLSELIDEYNESNFDNSLIGLYDNLPKREHSFWGFVGYLNEQSELLRRLSLGNQLFFQVIGQGGSGKSALINEVCHTIKETQNNSLNFHQIIWISSKSDILSNNQIKSIKSDSAYKSYDDLLRQLFLALNKDDISFYKDFLEFASEELEIEIKKFINGADKIKRLIIIDNLENVDEISQQKIISFFENSCDKPNYIIITSRHRIINDFPSYTFELNGLDPKSAEELLIKLMQFYEVPFVINSKDEKDKLKKFIKIANNYPLAIKYCVEKAKSEKISLDAAFEHILNGNTDLHKFIFHDTYSKLQKCQKRILQIVVVNKTEWDEDIDKNVLKVIFNTIWNDPNFDQSILQLYKRTLISYEGFNNEDVTVVLSDLITSHVDHIIKYHDIDTSRIYEKIKFFRERYKIKSNEFHGSYLTTSVIQTQIFNDVLRRPPSILHYQKALEEIKNYSENFYGIDYINAKLLELKNPSNIMANRKKIHDYYERVVRLKPENPLFWDEYIRFLKKNYKDSFDYKLKKKLNEIFRQYLETKNTSNKQKFSTIYLESLSITKEYKNENTILFMEDVIKNGIKISYKKIYLNIFLYLAETWVHRPNKINQINFLLSQEMQKQYGDTEKSSILKSNFELFKKMKEYVKK